MTDNAWLVVPDLLLMLVGGALWLPRMREMTRDPTAQAGFMIAVSAIAMMAGINVGGAVGQLVISVGTLMVVAAAVSIYRARRRLRSQSARERS